MLFDASQGSTRVGKKGTDNAKGLKHQHSLWMEEAEYEKALISKFASRIQATWRGHQARISVASLATKIQSLRARTASAKVVQSGTNDELVTEKEGFVETVSTGEADVLVVEWEASDPSCAQKPQTRKPPRLPVPEKVPHLRDQASARDVMVDIVPRTEATVLEDHDFTGPQVRESWDTAGCFAQWQCGKTQRARSSCCTAAEIPPLPEPALEPGRGMREQAINRLEASLSILRAMRDTDELSSVSTMSSEMLRSCEDLQSKGQVE